MKVRIAVGVDIGGTNTKLGLVTPDGVLRGFRSFKTQDFVNFENYAQALFRQIQELIDIKKTTSLAELPLAGIGVGVPNANWNTGMVEAPHNFKWGKIDLAHRLEAHFSLPTEIDNDANTAAIGESLFGVAKGVPDFIMTTLGTGVGTGVFAEGKIIRSANGKAGEGGHLIVDPKGRTCLCGGIGHLEGYCSSSGVEKTGQEVFGRKISTLEVSDLYAKGDVQAEKVVELTAEWLGLGFANMASILNPSLFVIGGGVSQMAADFDKRVQHWMDHYTFKSIRHEARVRLSATNQDTGSVLGAGALILHGKS